MFLPASAALEGRKGSRRQQEEEDAFGATITVLHKSKPKPVVSFLYLKHLLEIFDSFNFLGNQGNRGIDLQITLKTQKSKKLYIHANPVNLGGFVC